MADSKDDLKSRILSEMTVDYRSVLDQNFDLAKHYLRLSNEGKIEVIFRDKLNGPEKICLYLIGKIYAKEAGLIDSEDVSSKELINELAINANSLRVWLSELRDKNIIKQKEVNKMKNHFILINMVEKVLKDIGVKLKKEST